MEVHLHTPETLFNDPDRTVRYVVPDYQRRYVWKQEEQWEPLREDVLRLADQLVKPRRGKSQEPQAVVPHFLGSIVLMPTDASAGAVSTLAVVDGQQRLLTLQLMLDAARQQCAQRHPETARQLTALVRHHSADYGGDAGHEFTMMPSDDDDQVAYRDVMRDEVRTEVAYKSQLIIDAHKRFGEWFGGWLDEQPRESSQRAEALYSALAHHLQIAEIELGADDNEQIIFETLNSRGTPLRTFELVRNFLLREARRQDVDLKQLQRDHLSEFNLRWWDHTTGTGRQRRPHADAFLHHWLTMKTTQEIQLGQAFRCFKDHVTDEYDGRIEQAAADLSGYAKRYRELQTWDQTHDHLSVRFGNFIRRWNTLQADAFMPLILWLWAEDESDTRVSKAFAVLESYLIRRLICGLDTRGYPEMARQLLRRVKENPRKGADKSIGQHLLAVPDTPRERWPADLEVIERLESERLRGPVSATRTRMILEAIEMDFQASHWRTQGAKLAKRRLTVEHIMPQDWQNANWPAPKPELASQRETAQDVRNKLIHSIGNLTLVPRQYNSKLARTTWTRKSELYDQLSGDGPDGLKLNGDLLRPPRSPRPRVWDEEQIRKRSERLAKRVIRIWPRPS